MRIKDRGSLMRVMKVDGEEHGKTPTEADVCTYIYCLESPVCYYSIYQSYQQRRNKCITIQ